MIIFKVEEKITNKQTFILHYLRNTKIRWGKKEKKKPEKYSKAIDMSSLIGFSKKIGKNL